MSNIYSGVRMSKNYCNIWQEYEKYQLWIGYHMKVPNKILSIHFDRTISALNKYLVRSGIRHDIQSKLKRKSLDNKILNIENFITLLKHCGIDTPTVKAELQASGKWQLTKYTQEKMTQLAMSKFAPWEEPEEEFYSEISHKPKKHDMYATIQLCISFLNQNGIEVTPITTPNKLGWTYTLNNKPVTDAGLLANTNFLRWQKREPIYLIDGVTFED